MSEIAVVSGMLRKRLDNNLADAARIAFEMASRWEDVDESHRQSWLSRLRVLSRKRDDVVLAMNEVLSMQEG